MEALEKLRSKVAQQATELNVMQQALNAVQRSNAAESSTGVQELVRPSIDGHSPALCAYGNNPLRSYLNA